MAIEVSQVMKTFRSYLLDMPTVKMNIDAYEIADKKLLCIIGTSLALRDSRNWLSFVGEKMKPISATTLVFYFISQSLVVLSLVSNPRYVLL